MLLVIWFFLLMCVCGMTWYVICCITQTKAGKEEVSRLHAFSHVEHGINAFGILSALTDLLDFYVPCLFVLGYWLRQLSWEGRPGGQVTGTHAKRLLGACLALQVHLTGDTACRLEYTRTISVALLTWMPWYSRLPGAVFVEEACEALLRRVVRPAETTSGCGPWKTSTGCTSPLHCLLLSPEAPTVAGCDTLLSTC